MPLKELDLKTVDTYKKAMHQDLPKLSAGTKFWIYRDIEIPNAAGKKEKIPSFLALVDDRAIKPLLRGKKLICKGTCGLQDGKVAFDAESGAVPYRTLKKSVQTYLGKMVFIPANANEDDDGGEVDAHESESEESTPTSTTSTTAPTATPGLAATWNKLIEEVKAAIAAHPDRKDTLSQAAAGIPDLIKANKADEATQKMEHLRTLLAAPPSGAPSTASDLATTWNKLVKDVQAAAATHPERKDALSRAAAGIPDLIKANKTDEAKQRMEQLQGLLDAPSTGTTATAPSSGELTTRWNALVKHMQSEAAAHPEKKAELLRASAGIPDMIRAGKLDLAKKLMDGVDAVLAAPPGTAERVEEPQAKESEQAEVEETDQDPKAEFESRFPSLEEIALDTLKAGAGDTSQIRSVLAFAREKADKGDYAAALKSLDKLEDLVDQAEEEAQKPRVSSDRLVKYRTALLGFDKAKGLVDGQIANLQRTIPTILPEEADIADEIALRLTEWNDELADAIDEAMTTAEDEASPVTDEVRKSLDKYLNDLDGNELIRRVDTNPIAPTSIAATLRAALLNIKETMPVESNTRSTNA